MLGSLRQKVQFSENWLGSAPQVPKIRTPQTTYRFWKPDPFYLGGIKRNEIVEHKKVWWHAEKQDKKKSWTKKSQCICLTY